MPDWFDEKWLIEEGAAQAWVEVLNRQQGSPIFHMCDFNAYSSSIVVPPSDYQIIWLLFYNFVQRRWSLWERLR